MTNSDLTAYQHTVIAPYNRLLTAIVRNGYQTPITKMLLDQHVTFDLRPLNIRNGDWQMITPARRGSLAGSMKYAAAEAVWYLAHTRKIDLIVKYGKIWKQMTDDQGLINSNYGYQLVHNQNIEDCLEQLYQAGRTSLSIISQSNMNSTNDLVCNNRIDLRLLLTGADTMSLAATVNARSIDVIFGLPYDMFAAQGLMCMVADYLERTYHVHVRLTDLTFKMSNVHWYLRQNPSEEELAHLSTEVLTIPYRQTPYAINGLINRSLSDDDYQALIQQYRKTMVDKQMLLRVFSERDRLFSERDRQSMNHLLLGQDVICVKDRLDDLEKCLRDHNSELVDDQQQADALLEHWQKVMRPRLEANKFDRKVVWISDKHASIILYAVYYHDRYYLVRF